MLPIDHLTLQVRAMLAIDAAKRRAFAAFAALSPAARNRDGGHPPPAPQTNSVALSYSGEVNPAIADRKPITVTP
jgi:hypothetical protein